MFWLINSEVEGPNMLNVRDVWSLDAPFCSVLSHCGLSVSSSSSFLKPC